MDNVIGKWFAAKLAGILKGQPTSSSVHVPTAGSEKKKFGIYKSEDDFEKALYQSFDESADVYPPLNNLGAQTVKPTPKAPEPNIEVPKEEDESVEKAQLKGEEANPTPATDEVSSFLDMQRLVEGMDFEIDRHGSEDLAAFSAASGNITKDKHHYKKEMRKLVSKEDTYDESEDEDGLCLDLGSGHGREFGHLGIDTYPYDHGTIVHDLSLGIPFPDESAKKVTMKNVEMSDDIMNEIHRVLKPDGELHYQGKKDMTGAHPGMEMMESTDSVEKSADEQVYEQKFKKIRTDPATANDSEPKIGVPTEQILPTDQLLSMAAMGYYSDGATSARDNKLLGYPSQGGINEKEEKVKKGGPGSGRQPEGGGAKTTAEHEAASKATEARVKSAEKTLGRAITAHDENPTPANQAKEQRARAAHLEASTAHEAQLRAHVAHLKSMIGKSIPIEKGGPGSGGGDTLEIDMPKSPYISVGTRKGVLENMASFEDIVPMKKITHVGQEKYVPKKFGQMLANYDEIKDKPIDVLKVGEEYHVIDGHHRFLAAMAMGADKIKTRVRVKAESTFKADPVLKIMKASKEKQIVYGVILEPNDIDYQEDFMTADDIEETAHNYLKDFRVIGKDHSKPVDAYPVESYLAPVDFEITDGKYGPQSVKKGSWVLGVKVVDKKEWEKIQNGDYTGFSVGGLGSREEM